MTMRKYVKQKAGYCNFVIKIDESNADSIHQLIKHSIPEVKNMKKLIKLIVTIDMG